MIENLWPIVVGVLVGGVIANAWSARRKRRLQEERVNQPVSFGPPVVQTAGDTFLAGEIAPLLRPGEQVQHQAYVEARPSRAHFAFLTSERLLLVHTRVGAFGILFESHGVEAIERSDIKRTVEVGRQLFFELATGTSLHFEITSTSKLSNQDAFLRDVPRLLMSR